MCPANWYVLQNIIESVQEKKYSFQSYLPMSSEIQSQGPWSFRSPQEVIMGTKLISTFLSMKYFKPGIKSTDSVGASPCVL